MRETRLTKKKGAGKRETKYLKAFKFQRQFLEAIIQRRFLEDYLWKKLFNLLFTKLILMQSYPQGHWIEDSKKIGPEMQEKALGFS